MTQAGRQVLAELEAVRRDSAGPREFLLRFAERQAAEMAASDFARGCPVATVTLEMASRSEVIRAAAAQAFSAWTDLLTDAFGDTPDPRGTALLVLCALEGALVLARAWRNTHVITETAGRLAAAMGLPAQPARPSRRS